MDSDESIVRLNVSGRVFEISKDLLLTKRDSLLGKIVCDVVEHDKMLDPLKIGTDYEKAFEKLKNGKTLFFNRSATCFEAILSYYQTDELHLPSSVCPEAFKKELDYWKIDVIELEKCCRYKYLEFTDDLKTTITFEKKLAAERDIAMETLSGNSKLNGCRSKVWSLLEHQEKTVLSQIIRLFLIICVVMSIFTIALNTMDFPTEELNTCEIVEYLEEIDFDSDMIDVLRTANCTPIEDFAKGLKQLIQMNMTSISLGDFYYGQETLQYLLEQVEQDIPRIRKRPVVLVMIDYVLLAIFSVELLLRLWSCPSWKRYFMSVLNVIDIIVLVTSYIEMILIEQHQKYQYDDKGIKILSYLQILRALRIMRFVQNLASIRVLSYTLSSNLKDLVVMLLYMIIFILIFANFVYFTEDVSNFPNIPTAWWWAVITMTTVGYGDVAPKSTIGRILGSMCAVSGVLILALIIPVISGSFIVIYRFSKLHEINDAMMRKQSSNRVEPHGQGQGQEKKNAKRFNDIVIVEDTYTNESVYEDNSQIKPKC